MSPDRLRINLLAALIATGALQVSCDQQQPDLLLVPLTPTPVLATDQLEATQLAFPKGEAYADITNYYPELSNNLVYNFGQFNTLDQRVTRWYMFTQDDFDSQAASAAYSFFETLALKNSTFSYKNGDTTFIYKTEPTQEQERFLFVVDINMPLPKTYPQDADAATLHRGKGKTMISVVRVKGTTNQNPISEFLEEFLEGFMGNISGGADLAFAVEACQSSIVVTLDGKFDLAAQEGLCNSLGATYFFRQKGYSYNYYQRVMSEAAGVFQERGFPEIVVSEDFYNRIDRYDSIIANPK